MEVGGDRVDVKGGIKKVVVKGVGLEVAYSLSTPTIAN